MTAPLDTAELRRMSVAICIAVDVDVAKVLSPKFVEVADELDRLRAENERLRYMVVEARDALEGK